MDKEYIAKDFDKLLFNVYGFPAVPPPGDPKSKIIESFPVLKRFSSFKKPIAMLSQNVILKYIFFCFDKNSPLVLDIQNIYERRVRAVMLAGISPTKIDKEDRFDPVIEEILLCRNEQVNEMIIDFCVLQGDEDYFTYVTYQDAMLKSRLQLMNLSEDDYDKTMKIGQTIEYFKGLLQKTTNTFIVGSDENLRKALYNHHVSEKLSITPEAYAKEINFKNTV